MSKKRTAAQAALPLSLSSSSSSDSHSHSHSHARRTQREMEALHSPPRIAQPAVSVVLSPSVFADDDDEDPDGFDGSMPAMMLASYHVRAHAGHAGPPPCAPPAPAPHVSAPQYYIADEDDDDDYGSDGDGDGDGDDDDDDEVQFLGATGPSAAAAASASASGVSSSSSSSARFMPQSMPLSMSMPAGAPPPGAGLSAYPHPNRRRPDGQSSMPAHAPAVGGEYVLVTLEPEELELEDEAGDEDDEVDDSFLVPRHAHDLYLHTLAALQATSLSLSFGHAHGQAEAEAEADDEDGIAQLGVLRSALSTVQSLMAERAPVAAFDNLLALSLAMKQEHLWAEVDSGDQAGLFLADFVKVALAVLGNSAAASADDSRSVVRLLAKLHSVLQQYGLDHLEELL